jgi:hypothetical protein
MFIADQRILRKSEPGIAALNFKETCAAILRRQDAGAIDRSYVMVAS